MKTSNSRWKFSLSVMLPVIAATLLTVALAAGFLLWASSRADLRALERQQAVASRLVEMVKSLVARSQSDQVLRYEVADVFVGGKPDTGDIDDNFGVDEYQTYEHNSVYVLDPELHPIYAAREGESADPKSFALIGADVQPLLDALRTPAAVAQTKSYQDGDADRPPQAIDLVRISGRVAIATAMPIVSNWEGQEQKRFFTHVVIRFLDADAYKQILDQYMIEGAHFDAVSAALPTDTVIPLANTAGRFVAYLKWVPDLPGRALLNETLPALAGLILVVGVLIGLLLFGLSRSTRALERARAEAHHRATHDPLTGLANRALFTERLERSPLPLTLLALDLDRFKAVNDTLGHEAGDELLKQVAARLGGLVRDADTVARLGGDEFMILLSGPIDAGDVQTLASRVVTALSQPFSLTQGIANIGVSVGIARAETDERKELVARADFALYDAKESGRNTFRMFDDVKKAA